MMEQADWAVVGAGPAGILAVGKLLDYGVAANDIIWLDPEFSVGDLGRYWREVPSNTKVAAFRYSLYATKAFAYDECAANAAIRALADDDHCPLDYMVAPLQAITKHLATQVTTAMTTVSALNLIDDKWNLTTSQGTVVAKKVIIATGSEPLLLDHDIPVIPLATALTPSLLSDQNVSGETIAVFGSSHSAILVIKNLIEQGANIVNFYRSPIRHAIYHEDWIEYSNTGLKGVAAEFAKQYIESPHPNIQRYQSNKETIAAILPTCTRAVYAVGFARRSPTLEGVSPHDYDNQCGLIARNLYGCGIAYPELIVDRGGNEELNVGIKKFSIYLDRVIPKWLND